MAKRDRRKGIMLKSEVTDTCYYSTKGDTQEKLALKKYDPAAFNKETGKYGMHVTFKEKKIPK